MSRLAFCAGALGLALLVGTFSFTASPGQAEESPVTTYYQEAARSQTRLMMAAGEIDPTRELFKLPAGFDAPARRSASGRQYLIVQFDQQTTRAELDRWEADGFEFLAVIPHNGFAVRTTTKSASMARARANVRWASDLLPGFKVEPFVLDEATVRRERGQSLDVLVSIWPGESRAVAAKELRLLGADILQVPKSTGAQRLLIRMAPDALAQAAALGEVEWIEPRPNITQRNNSATGVLQSGVDGNRSIWDRGLHGEGQVIGHIDGPIDIGSCFFRDETSNTPGPLHRKIVAYRGSSGSDSHGTHTAGTAAGINVSGSTNHAGHAYEAKISHSAFDVLSGLGDNPTNLADLLLAAQQDGAYVHTNSYGDDNFTNYTHFCVDIDTFTWNNEDGMVVFASTNAGGVLYSPENSKNVLAVGNAAHAPNFNNETTLSGGSCSGPTADGRRKPEIYAPGTSTVSAFPGTCLASTMSGTSMASPAITGEAALARQYFLDGFYPRGAATQSLRRVPSGALLKAIVLNGSVDMTGIAGYPSNKEGWGRLVLDNALHFAGETRRTWLKDARRTLDEGLDQGDVHEFQIEVIEAAEPLKVTLVWMDPPVARNASQVPVNNLNLEVVAPGPITYRGNVFSGGLSTTGGTADTINNVEMVLLNAPATGTYTVRVAGATVNALHGNQGYALVASGGLGDPQDAHLSLSSALFGCGSSPQIGLFDGNAVSDTLMVTLTTAEGESEQITLDRVEAGLYSANVAITESAPTPSNGTVEIQSQTQVTVTYDDADPALGQSAQLLASAAYDCSPPLISNVTFPNVLDVVATIRFQTNESAIGTVNLMTSCGGKEDLFPFTETATNTYEATLPNLASDTPYFVSIQAEDSAGNSTIADNNGQCYTFRTATAVTSSLFDFESGTQGFTTQVAQGTGADWTRMSAPTTAHSPDHLFFVPNLNQVVDSSLLSPEIAIPATNPYLAFWHTFEFESGGWDGGVLDVSTDGGGIWSDLGSRILIGGYNGQVPSNYQNPLPGGSSSRQAWVNGSKGDMARVLVDMSDFAGQTVRFRWRIGCDVSFGADGWYVDDVEILQITGAPDPIGTSGFLVR